MESKIILGRLVQRIIDQGYAQVNGYNRFEYFKHNESSITILRENGQEALIPFKKLLIGIEGYQSSPSDYNTGPTALRKYGLTHITSPIFAILHLLDQSVYT
jgi:hypothetical protein